MSIQFTGLNTEATEALCNYAREKLSRLDKLAHNVSNIHVTFDVNKNTHIVEATLHMPKTDIHAKAESEDMYKSINLLVDKLTAQLNKHKDKLTDHN